MQITQMEKNTNINEILTCFNLKQHINFPTHVHGYWLDLLITKHVRQQVSQTILRSYKKLTVVRRNETKKKNCFEK